MGRRLLTYSAPYLSIMINTNPWNKLGKTQIVSNGVQAPEVDFKEINTAEHYWEVSCLTETKTIWGTWSILETCFSSPYQVWILLCWARWIYVLLNSLLIVTTFYMSTIGYRSRSGTCTKLSPSFSWLLFLLHLSVQTTRQHSSSLPFPTKSSSLIIVISKHLDYAFFLLAAKVTSVNNWSNHLYYYLSSRWLKATV